MKQSAFTLIELLVVIVIIGILATISTATFGDYSHKARDAKTTQEVNEIYEFILADIASREGSYTLQSDYIGDNDPGSPSKTVVEAIYNLGGSLPDPNEACYTMVIQALDNNINIGNAKNSGFAIIAVRSHITELPESIWDPSEQIPSFDYDFDNYMIAAGTPSVLEVLNSNSGGWGWAHRIAARIDDDQNAGCGSSIWWHMAVRGTPYNDTFWNTALDPSLAPSE